MALLLNLPVVATGWRLHVRTVFKNVSFGFRVFEARFSQLG